MKNIFILISLTLIGFMGCTKKEAPVLPVTTSPEEVVRSFVRLSGEAKEVVDKSKLASLCSGEMKAAFDDMNDEQFRLFYLNGNLNVQELKILSTNINKDQATVLYQVVVENRQGTDVTKETNEREVVLNQVAGGWLIDTVRPKGTDKLIFSKGMVF
ncbi:MAG: hypothetical protein EBQ92_10335 [Proteobacteria bacterium]|nr:hypothetical protein [Pseudomonadota bacterium]